MTKEKGRKKFSFGNLIATIILWLMLLGAFLFAMAANLFEL